jgi:hypothetical protein
MSPDELEAHIKDCGRLMQEAMARFEVSSCFADRGDADHWRMQMEEAIAMRTPETVARMEHARGLA